MSGPILDTSKQILIRLFSGCSLNAVISEDWFKERASQFRMYVLNDLLYEIFVTIVGIEHDPLDALVSFQQGQGIQQFKQLRAKNFREEFKLGGIVLRPRLIDDIDDLIKETQRLVQIEYNDFMFHKKK